MKFDFEIDGHSFSVIQSSAYEKTPFFIIYGESVYGSTQTGYYLNDLDFVLRVARHNYYESNSSIYINKLHKKIKVWEKAKNIAWQKINKFKYLK